MTIDPAEFARKVAAAMRVSNEHVGRLGESHGVVTRLGDRVVELWTDGTVFWLIAELSLPDFPDELAVLWAPEGTYVRAQLLESSAATSTDDAAFDKVFVVCGATDHEVTARLTALVRTVLLDNAGLQVDLQAVEVRTQLHQRLHLRARAGTAGWTPEGAVAALNELVDLATCLETIWPRP